MFVMKNERSQNCPRIWVRPTEPSVSPGVTSRLEVRYLAPVPVEEPLRISAQVVERGDRRVRAEASILDRDGLVLAHAQADVVLVRPEHFLSTERGRARGLDWLPRN